MIDPTRLSVAAQLLAAMIIKGEGNVRGALSMADELLAAADTPAPLPTEAPTSAPTAPPGPAPDPLNARMPVAWVLEHWIAGIQMPDQTIRTDKPSKAVVWEDDQLRAYNPESPYWQSNDSFVFGEGGYEVEYGLHLFRLPASHNAVADEPVWEPLFMGTPSKNRWPGYPYAAGYKAGYDSTIPRTFRITGYRADGSIYGIVKMDRDDLPINHPSLQQFRNENAPWRPFVNVAQQLYLPSAELKLAPHALSIYGGTRPEWNRPKTAAGRTMSNAAIPVFGTGNQQVNGFLHLLYMEEWAQSTSAADWDQVKKDDPNVNWRAENDPSGNATNGARNPTSAVGWRKEHGAFNAGHDPAPGKGGMRFTLRGLIPAPLAYAVTDLTGRRVHGNVPWMTICHEYFKGGFNIPYHFVLDAKTGEMPPMSVSGYGKDGYMHGFYNPSMDPKDKTKWIDMHGMGTNAVWRTTDFDRDGLHPYTGWTPENQHQWEAPWLYSAMFGSVAAATSQKLHFYSVMRAWNIYYSEPAANMGDIRNIDTAPQVELFMRQMGVRWSALLGVWKTCVDQHPLFASRSEIEPIIRLHLESLHDNVMVPATDPTHPNYNHYFYQGLRNLGVPVRKVTTVSPAGSTHKYVTIDDDKRFYFHEVLTLWRTTGLFDAAMKWSPKCAAVLPWIVRDCYGKMGAERVVATCLRQENYQLTPEVPTSTPLVMPADWFVVDKTMQPQDASDMVRNADLTPYRGTTPNWQRERWLYQHDVQQCVYNTLRHFADLRVPRIEIAVRMCDEWEAYVAADIAAGGPEYRLRHIHKGPNMAPARVPG